MPLRASIVVVSLLLLVGGCRAFVAGLSEDSTQLAVGHLDANVIAKTSHFVMRFPGLAITCTGDTRATEDKGGVGDVHEGSFTCSDGRKGTLRSVVETMSGGSGVGRDECGNVFRYLFDLDQTKINGIADEYRERIKQTGKPWVDKCREPAPPPKIAAKPAPPSAPTAAVAQPQHSYAPAGSLSSDGPRLALVIGNSRYHIGPLKNPVNDARLMSTTLRSLGFTVFERLDLDQRGMKSAIIEFGDSLERAGKNAVGLFYYAGHGIQVSGVNFLVPVDAAIRREKDVDVEAVSAQTVAANMTFAGNRINIIILDACRNNPFKRSFRSAVRGLAPMEATQGMLIAYATAPGDVAKDGAGNNSPYTGTLAQVLRTPGLTIERVFKQVRNQVVTATAQKQVPWEASSLTGGDFYFIPPSGGAAAAATPTMTTPAAAGGRNPEIVFWESIKDSKDPAMFEAYLKQFPHGTFRFLAEAKVRALRGN